MGPALGEEGLDEVLLDVHVLVEKLGQGPLIQVRPDPHHRELEEARHRRRQAVNRAPIALDVHEEGPARKLVQDPLRVRRRDLPRAGRGLGVEGLDRQERDQGGLLLAEQHLEDVEQQIGGRRSLGEAVEPLGQPRVARLEGPMRHGPPRQAEYGISIVQAGGAGPELAFPTGRS